MSGFGRSDQYGMSYKDHNSLPKYNNFNQNYDYNHKKNYRDNTGYSYKGNDSSHYTNEYSYPPPKYNNSPCSYLVHSRKTIHGSKDLQNNNNNKLYDSNKDIDMRQRNNLPMNDGNSFNTRRSFSVPPKKNCNGILSTPFQELSSVQQDDINKDGAKFLVPQPKSDSIKPKETLNSSCPKSSKSKDSSSKTSKSKDQSPQSKHSDSGSQKNVSISDKFSTKSNESTFKSPNRVQKPPKVKCNLDSSKNRDSQDIKESPLKLSTNESIHKYLKVRESPSNYDKTKDSKSPIKDIKANEKPISKEVFSQPDIKRSSSTKSKTKSSTVSKKVDAELKTPNNQKTNVLKCEYRLESNNISCKDDNSVANKIHDNVIIAPTFVSLQSEVIPPDSLQGKQSRRKRTRDSILNESPKKPKTNNDSGDSKNNTWKVIFDLDNKIASNDKAKKAQRKIVENLKKEYTLESEKLKEFKDLKKTLLNERNQILTELQKVVVESSDEDESEESDLSDDDDVEIVDKRNIIEVSSSSESESDGIEDANKIANDTISLIMPNEIVVQNGSKSTSQSSGDIFGKLLVNGPMGAVEPKLDTIFVSKQKDTFISDIKVFCDHLFIACSHGILRQYNMKTHECTQHYVGHYHLIHSIFLTIYQFNSGRLFSGGYDNNLLIHDITTGNIIDSVKTIAPIMTICEGNNNNIYYGCSDGFVGIYSLEKKCLVKDFNVTNTGLVCIVGLKDPTKSMLFVGSANGELSMWDTNAGTKLKNISVQDHKGVPIGFITLPQQRLLVYSKNNIHFLYYASDKVPVTFNNCTKNNSLCITKNYIIVGNTMGAIFVHRIKGSTIHKNPILTFMNSNSQILSITFYNNTIISGDKTGNVYFNRLIEK